MPIFKILSLKIEASESIQYFEISQVLNNKHMNSIILKWLHPLVKAFEINIFYTYCSKQKKDACTESGTVRCPKGTKNIYAWSSERRNKL